MTNNDAEYDALIAGLKLALEMKVENISIHSDFMLITYHVNGGYQALGPRTELYMRSTQRFGGI